MNGAQIPKRPSLMENRLQNALSNLRSQCRVLSSERKLSTNSQSSAMDTSTSLTKTRDLQRLLVQARTSEADLQDEVDTMKCEIGDYKFRIRELESIVDEWREKFEREVTKGRTSRDETESRLSDARLRISEVKESCKDELIKKEDEIAVLTRIVAELQAVCREPLRLDASSQVDAASTPGLHDPKSPTRSPAHLTYTLPPPRRVLNLDLMSASIPDFGRSFSTAATSPLFRLV